MNKVGSILLGSCVLSLTLVTARSFASGGGRPPVLSASASESAGAFCQLSWEDFQRFIARDENRLAFTNSKGPMGIGLCWWHTRMQRNAHYLGYFSSSDARPSKEDAWKIIKKFTSTGDVVLVPGYVSLRQFSDEYSQEMTEALGQWQIVDSFVKQGWIHGLAGSSTAKPEKIVKGMDELSVEVNDKHKLVYQVLEMPGLEAHAWIVSGIQKDQWGYRMQVVDSNFTNMQEARYYSGSTTIEYNGYPNFVPVTEHDGELRSIQKSVTNFCSSIQQPAGLSKL